MPRKEKTTAEETVTEKTTAEETENKDGYVKFCLPFLPGKTKGDYQTVTINGKNYQVKYGETVNIPVGVRDVLVEMLAQSELIDRKIAALKKERCISTIE